MTQTWKINAVLWTLGMVGVVTITFSVLPRILAGKVLPLPVSVLSALSLLQTAVLLALAIWAGTASASRVGLSAPAISAVASRQRIWPALQVELLPGLLGGVVGGVVLATFKSRAPAAMQEALNLPLTARLLYGGITEEIFMRWGVLSVLLWLGWRLLQPGSTVPSAALAWSAILVSAVLFAGAHIPGVGLLTGPISRETLVFVLVGNSVLGALFGYLYWSYGLESAMICHALSHAVAYVLHG